jgi:iron complex transport system substrate-binding protein
MGQVSWVQPFKRFRLKGFFFAFHQIDGEKRVMRTQRVQILAICLSVWLWWGLAAQGAGLRQLTDPVGRQVKMPETVHRVVALAPSITEIVFALHRENRLVGVTQFSDYPETAQRLPKVGSYVQLDVERIAALRPDVCIAVKDGNPIDAVRQLEAFNIPVYAVNPKTLEEVMDTVSGIGKLLDANKAAAALVSQMKARIARIKALAANAVYKPRVFFQIGISPIVSAGSATLIDELIGLAGGLNLARGPVTYPRYSKEEIIAMAPDILIITSMARGEVFDQVKASWNLWPQMPAVRNQRIFLVDSNLFDRPTPRLVDGLEKLFRLIHPELAGGKS